MSIYKKLSLKLQYFIGSLLYVSYTPQALVYSLKRDKLERQFHPSVPVEGPTQPAKLIRAESTDKGGRFTFEHAELEITFLSSDLVRVDWQPGILPIPYAISRSDWESVPTVLRQIASGWSLSAADGIAITVTSDGNLTWHDASGRVLREELPPMHRGEAWIHTAQLQPEERIYGLGERAAPLNLRQGKDKEQQPKTYRMWNFDAAGKYSPGADPLYVSIPVYLGLHSQGSYFIFYENSFSADFTFGATATAAFEGGALRYYLSYGPPERLLERYTELTGRTPLPPRWALGYHQSRWGYETEAAVRETVQEFRTRDLPLSAVHLDIDCQVGYRAFTIDPDRFAKLATFTQELVIQGVHLITILNPGIKYSSKDKLFMEGKALGVLCLLPDTNPVIAPVWPGWSVFPDFTNPLARQWWGRQYEYLLDLGISGFWHDMNEPAAFILWGDRSLPRVTRHALEGRGGDHREAHNVYGMLQTQAGYESLCQYRPNKRPFILSRAGWAGMQRYSWTWTGDIECTWAAMRQTIATVVGLGLSGVPFSGPDIGGFQGNPSAELYIRWFQMSSFLPFFRSHCSNNVAYRTPWTYGEPCLGILRQFLKLRYQLLPYFYTLAWKSSCKGYPLVRPLFWRDNEEALWDVDDAFLLGDSLLICPVCEAGARTWQVPLPTGRWFSFWDDTVFEGPGRVTVEAPLEQIPLLVRAGSILATEQDGQLVLHLYPQEHGEVEADLYCDAGDGCGVSRIDRFGLKREQNTLILTHEQQGEYTFPYIGWQLILHGYSFVRLQVDGTDVPMQGGSFKQLTFLKYIFI